MAFVPAKDFIDQLERLTVRDTWAGQVMGEVSYYRLNGGYFGNKADFATSFQTPGSRTPLAVNCMAPN